MIHNLSGDLLLSSAALLAHGVAPHDDFKSGLALALREACPAMYKDFRHYCKLQNPKSGTLWQWQGVNQAGRHVRIAALFTQEKPSHEGGHPGPAHTEYVNHALHELRKLVTDEKIPSLALPRLATGKGGLDWQHVEAILRTQLGALSIPVFVYTSYVKGLAAKEPMQAKTAH